MNAFSDAVEAKIIYALNRLGETGAIRRVTGTNDPGTPWDPSDDTLTTTDYAVTLVEKEFSLRERESSLIEQGDRKVYVSTDGLTITPALSDKLVIGTDVLEIMDVERVKMSGEIMVYKLQVRSGS